MFLGALNVSRDKLQKRNLNLNLSIISNVRCFRFINNLEHML